MRALRRWVARAFATISRRDGDARVREELESHLDMLTAENLRAGMPPDAARRHAVLTLGSIDAIRDRYADEQRLAIVDDLAQDARYALRQLRKAPLFTLTAVLSLAAGIGANAAVFTLVERVLLRPLPVSNPDELVYVADQRALTQPGARFSYPLYEALRETTALDGVAARFALGLNVTVNGQTVRAHGELVSGNYFDVLGVGARPGRPLAPEDDRTPGAHPVAVISEAFRQKALGAGAAAVGQPLIINGLLFTIVGIAANGFAGIDVGEGSDIWVPLSMQRELGRDHLRDARTNWLELIGRLRPGSSGEQSAAALDAQLRLRASAVSPDSTLVLLPADSGRSPAQRDLRSALLVLFALTALALALACVNVACLAAVRAAAREREMAIRLALGAGRPRLRRQLLTEGLVLSLLAGVAGALTAPWLARALVAARSITVPIDRGLEPRVLLFVAATSLLAGFVVAIVPILASRRATLTPGAHGSRTGALFSRRLGAHDLVMTLQIAMALSMLISAALLLQSLRSFRSVDPGFRADDLFLATLDPAAAGYDSARIDGFWRSTLDRVGRIPGVQSASLARVVPLAPGRQRQRWINPATGEKIELDTNFVGPRYFGTLDIPLLGGRDFVEHDGRTSRPVVIVNDRLARMFWPQQDAIGKGIRLPDAGNPIAEVVAVVRDVKYQDLRGDAAPMFYRPVLQSRSTDALALHVRTSSGPAAIVSAIRLAVQSVDRNVPLFEVTTLEERLDASFAQTRQAALLTGTFGLLAFLLSAIGVYGVTALAVGRRTRDIGIRMALGARRLDIVRAIGARIVALIAIGLALGLAASLGFARVTATLMFGVTTADLPTFAAMAAALATVSLLAFSVPLRAATRLDALDAIRHE